MIHPRFNMLKHSLVMAELNANANIVVRKKELHGFEPKHEISSSKWERGGRISHDKKYVAYIRLVPGGSELWLHEFSTGDDQRIVISHDYIVSVAWSPDDKRLALNIASNKKSHVDIFERESKRLFSLPISEPDNQHYPVWSPDGNSVYFASNTDDRWSIWNSQLSNFHTEEIVHKGGNKLVIDERGDTLYFSREGEAGFWKFAVHGDGEPTAVSNHISPRAHEWHYQDGAFYYTKISGTAINTVYRYRPDEDKEDIYYIGPPFLEMHLRDDYLSTSDLHELSGDIYLKQYASGL